MKNTIRVSNIKQPVYLTKGKFGYRIVHPIKNKDGSYNLINLLLGGWENFFKLLFTLFVIFCFLYGAKEMLRSCNDMAENPCKYFDIDCTRYYNQQTYETGLGLRGVSPYEQQNSS